MKNILTIAIITLLALGCKNKTTVTPVPAKKTNYKNVVILGNSITFTPQNLSIGWTGNWGMAASSAETDYVHLLTRHFQNDNPLCIVTAKNIADFEYNYRTYDFDTNLKNLRDSKPDLLLLRIGENLQPGYDAAYFESRYVDLINYFKSVNPNVEVLAVGSFWPREDTDKIMRSHSDFITLGTIGGDVSNWAGALFTNPGVSQHPGDKGMKAISDTIWSKVEKLNK